MTNQQPQHNIGYVKPSGLGGAWVQIDLQRYPVAVVDDMGAVISYHQTVAAAEQSIARETSALRRSIGGQASYIIRHVVQRGDHVGEQVSM